MSSNSLYRRCVECEKWTDQTCLWCGVHLHRHDDRQTEEEAFEYTECWNQHQIDCVPSLEEVVRAGQ